MEQAYLEYDPVTGSITGIHWAQPAENWVSISSDLAILFMEGAKKLHLHRVIMDLIGAPVLDSLRERPPVPMFRDPLPEDISEKIRIKINKASVTVTLVHDIQHNVGLFVTLKNDPTWLVSSFNITRIYGETGKNSANIKMPNAADYSYHIGAIDEI